MPTSPESASQSEQAATSGGQSPPTTSGDKRLEGEEVGRSWYVPPKPTPKSGWLVFSSDFILAGMQGCAADPHEVRRTPWWKLVAGFVLANMAVAQCVVMFLSWLPIVSMFMEMFVRTFAGNAAGFFLRACYWKTKLEHLGQDTMIDQYVDIRGPGSVSIGSNSHIDAYVRLKAGERRYGQHGSIKIGNYIHIGPGCILAGRGGLVIEDFVSLSADARLYSASNTIEHPDDPGKLISISHSAPHGQQFVIEKPIVVEEYAFVGMMTCVLPGVRIGRGAIIHPNCEITRDVPPFANVGGVPRGRQIGWRRPRRPSPHLKSDEGSSPDPGKA